MAFRGLFIGIDRYQSNRVNWLSCAARDATALHALFADNLGGELVLLVNQTATRFNIEAAFKDLAKVDSDDVVVIYYSGHGSETHEIVTYDADVDRLEQTALPLAVLLDLFKTIQAKRIVCVLDCCFSGAMGAKCLQVENKSRSIHSTEEILDWLLGEGRIIITAASANQLAWENARFGHGFLTYHLIEGLKGAEEVTEAGKVSFYKLIEYISSHVTAAVASIGKQHPNVRWTIDKAFYWPIFKIGNVFKTAFPEAIHQQVTSDLKSLKAFGFPNELIDAWAVSIPSLNQLQIDAINLFGILGGSHLIVSAPTSSGKTMIGELAALNGLLKRQRALFLFPLKALVNDKHRHFNKTYGQFGYKTIRATGDSTDDVPLLKRGQYDICLMTYEKFTALILSDPFLLEQVGTIVIDEVQMIADKNRGTNLEFILTLLRIRRRQGIEPQIIGLSAVIGDTNGLEYWLDARLLKRTERPVPIDEGIITGNGSFKYLSDKGDERLILNLIQRELRNEGNQEWVIPLVRKLVSEGKQVIVFREKTGEARGTANYLAESLKLPPAESVLKVLPKGDPSIMSEALRKSLLGGVALHTSNLDRDERLIIEEYFRMPKSEIRVIAATTTLAMGVNTPAEAVVIVGLEHPGEQPEPYSIAEYKNMVGRAGRLGYSEHGTSYLLALTPREEYDHWNNYVLGKPEDLTSRFLSEKTDPRSLIIKVLVSAKRTVGTLKKQIGLKAVDIIDFLEGSFGAFLQKRTSESWRWNTNQLIDALNNLERHDLVKRNTNDIYELTELGWIAGHGGIEVESITRLVDILRPIDKDLITDPTLIAATQIAVEVDQLLFTINSKGARKELATWTNELQMQNIPNYVLDKLQSVNDSYQAALRMKKAAACLLWITDKSLEEMESILTKHGGKWDGAAGSIRRISERTHDILHITAAVAEYLKPGLDLSERVSNLFTRLEIGIPSCIVELGKTVGTQFTRGDYRSLMNAGLNNIETIDASSDKSILDTLDGNQAKLLLLREAIQRYKKRYEEKNEFVYPLIPIYQP